MSITCESFEAFKKGKCNECNRNNNFCIKFGFHSQQSYKTLYSRGFRHPGYPATINTYLMTSEKEPYCKVHFKVFVKIASHDESRMHGGEVGLIYLKLKGEEHGVESSKFLLNQQPIFFKPGGNHTFLAISDNIENPASAIVDFRHKQTVNPLTWRVFTPKIYVEYIVIQSMENSASGELKLCANYAQPIISGEGLIFTQESCDYRRNSENV
jgi:hypothetical protein